LADGIKTQLNAVLSPRYYAHVEVYTVLEEVDIAATKTVYPDAAVLETVAATPASATAVAIPAAPIERLAMLPEEHKIRTVQVHETATATLVTAIEILSPVNKLVLVSTCTATAPNVKASYRPTCISSSWICSAAASGRGGKSRSRHWSVSILSW
jgi:hypothetical protein